MLVVSVSVCMPPDVYASMKSGATATGQVKLLLHFATISPYHPYRELHIIFCRCLDLF